MDNDKLDRLETKIEKLSVQVEKLSLTVDRLSNKLEQHIQFIDNTYDCLLYTSPSPRD